MDFVREFKRRVKEIEKRQYPLADIKDREKAPRPSVEWDQQLYSIYKRSLPVGVNLVILSNLTEDDAKRAMKRLKLKQYTDADGTKHAIYYDMVLQTDPRQQSIYWNGKPIVREEGSDQEVELLNGPEKFNETWVG